MGDTLDGGGAVGRGFYVEDGGNPSFLDWLVDISGAAGLARRAAAFALHRTWAHLSGRPRSNLSGDLARVLGDRGPSSNTLPILAMGRDIPDGVMRLRNGDLDLDWTTRTSADYFARVQRTLGDIAEVLGARLANTPLWLFKRVITVHPLGGCPMGAHPETGVVNAWGEVWNYPGLSVVDGSVMRGPVGPNPSLTIAAFAERAAMRMLEGSTK
jgi:cholesterol oxidase